MFRRALEASPKTLRFGAGGREVGSEGGIECAMVATLYMWSKCPDCDAYSIGSRCGVVLMEVAVAGLAAGYFTRSRRELRDSIKLCPGVVGELEYG